MKTTLRSYQALSIEDDASTIVTTFALLFIGLIALLAEILFARIGRKQGEQRREKTRIDDD